MTIRKVASAYAVPACILGSLLGGHFFSELGFLEKWFLGENEIRQVVSSPLAASGIPNSAQVSGAVLPSKWPAVAYDGQNDRGSNGETSRTVTKPAKPNESEYNLKSKTDWQANAYEDSVKTAHRTAQAYFNYALTYQKSGQLEQAIQAYQQALIHQRNLPGALLNLGALHYRRQDWQKAREAFETASLLDGTSVKAHFNLSMAHGKLGELDKAEQAARRALALDDKNAATYNLLGLIHALQGEYDTAVSIYKQGLAIDAQDASLLSNLSLAYQKMARGNRAETNL